MEVGFHLIGLNTSTLAMRQTQDFDPVLIADFSNAPNVSEHPMLDFKQMLGISCSTFTFFSTVEVSGKFRLICRKCSAARYCRTFPHVSKEQAETFWDTPVSISHCPGWGLCFMVRLLVVK